MDVKISRKRSREADVNDCSDCLPLSKRINSLYIDNSHFPSSSEGLFQINVNVEQNQEPCNPIPSSWQSPPAQCLPLLPNTNFPLQNHNSMPDWSQPSGSSNIHNHQTDSHHMHNYPQPPNVTIPNQPSHQEWSNREPTSWVNRLKYSHDNMDSEYYVNNRLLFDLYVERISRTGQSPANPY